MVYRKESKLKCVCLGEWKKEKEARWQEERGEGNGIERERETRETIWQVIKEKKKKENKRLSETVEFYTYVMAAWRATNTSLLLPATRVVDSL